jgi:DNA gyrase subunit A
MNIIDHPEETLLVLSEYGYGKRTALNQYKQQNRGGKGLITYKVTEKTGRLIGAKLVTDEEDLMVISQEGIVIRLSCEEVSLIGRSTQGVRIMHVSESDRVVSIAKVAFDETEEDQLQDIIAQELTEHEDSDNE